MARSAAPRQRGGECGAVAQDGAGAQAWLETRLRGLSEDDFDGSIRIFCTSNLEPPEAFRDVWHAVPEELGLDEGLPLLSDKDAAGLNTVLIFCNPTRSSEVRRLSEIITNIDVHSTNAPPMFWVPHSVAPDRRGQNFSDLVPPDIVRELLHKGLDGIVSGEPAGTALSMAVLVKICKSANLSRRLNDMVSEGHVRTQHAQYLQQCAQDAVWGFAATRLAPDFPPVDDTLQPGLLQELPGYTVGNKLGEGKLGSVYRLTESPEAGMNVYALKMVPKSARIRNLQLVQNMTRVMTVLSDERWRHPNITRLYQTHHTPTHILFRLEYGGPENLYHRLQDRRRPLALDDAAAVVAQVLDGPYDGCAADIWSVGVVLAEVLCGARVLEFAVEGAADAAFADNIRTYFRAPAAVADLLEGRCHPQLRPLLPLCGAVIGGMLEVDPARRLEAGDVRPVVGQGMAPLAAGRVAPGRPAPSARPLAPGGQPTPGLPRAASAAGPPR